LRSGLPPIEGIAPPHGFLVNRTQVRADRRPRRAVRAEALRAWSVHPEHLEAKKKGRAAFYSEYRVLVCAVERESRFPRS
jgi:hypothetical protein